jgi:hypothetical protein
MGNVGFNRNGNVLINLYTIVLVCNGGPATHPGCKLKRIGIDILDWDAVEFDNIHQGDTLSMTYGRIYYQLRIMRQFNSYINRAREFEKPRAERRMSMSRYLVPCTCRSTTPKQRT